MKIELEGISINLKERKKLIRTIKKNPIWNKVVIKKKEKTKLILEMECWKIKANQETAEEEIEKLLTLENEDKEIIIDIPEPDDYKVSFS